MEEYILYTLIYSTIKYCNVLGGDSLYLLDLQERLKSCTSANDTESIAVEVVEYLKKLRNDR